MKNKILQKTFLMISSLAFVFLLLRYNLFSIISVALLLMLGAYCILRNKIDFSEMPKKGYFVFATFFEVIMSVGFYEQWCSSSALENIFSKFNIGIDFGLMLSLMVCMIVALPFFARFSEMVLDSIIECINIKFPETSQKIHSIVTDIYAMRKIALVLFFIITVALLAVIRADYAYRDDLTRVVMGYKSWEDFGRFGSNYLSTIFHSGSYLTDVSPLTQIVSCAIMAVACVFTIYVFRETTKIKVWDILAVIPFVLSPFLLQCFTYKYDSPYMTMSILLAIVPFLFWKNNRVLFSVVSVICLVLMCTFYQAASGIYITFVILLSLRDWNVNEKETKSVFQQIAVSAVSFVIAIFFFKFVILPLASSYNYRSTEAYGLSEMLVGVFNNIRKYFEAIGSSLKIEWIIIISLAFIMFPIYMTGKSKRNKFLSFLLSVSSLLIASVFSYGIYMILKEPAYDFRSMVGFAALISGVLLLNRNNENKFNYSNIAAMLLGVMLFSFSFSYGNALNEQSKYVNYKFSCLANDLAYLERINSDEELIIHFDGSIGSAKSLSNMPENYDVIRKMVVNDSWEYAKFIHYYGVDNLVLSEENLPANLPFELECENAFYKIHVYEKYILVEMKP